MLHFIENLLCPITKNSLRQIEEVEFQNYPLPKEYKKFGTLKRGLVDLNNEYFYPIFGEIIVLHSFYAIHIGKGIDIRKALSFDKKRVFDYYNEVDYLVKESFKIYEDSDKWVDYRPVASAYIRNSFTNASKFYPNKGEFILDAASGPIGLSEYISLCDGYKYRICIDISINALIQAKSNLERADKKGIFICGDITNIPIRDMSVDTVLSQHTLYHLPKGDQKLAVNEMYRVAKRNSKIVIIYSWFYHSWFMNITLNFVQIYRILRHLAGKLYVKIMGSKPRLYFYPHSPKWFLTSFEFSKDIEFHCWRSCNKHFLKIYVHEWFFGRKILAKLATLEHKYDKFMGTFGEYPAIVITKSK